MGNQIRIARDCTGEFSPDEIGASLYITNDGPDEIKKPDQRKIETLPAPPNSECEPCSVKPPKQPGMPTFTHAERETFEVEDENGYPLNPYLCLYGTMAPVRTPSITELDDEFRGCSAGYIAGFTDQPMPEDADPDFVSEYVRGEMARYEQKLAS